MAVNDINSGVVCYSAINNWKRGDIVFKKKKKLKQNIKSSESQLLSIVDLSLDPEGRRNCLSYPQMVFHEKCI